MHSGGVMLFGDIERKYVCECGEMWSKAEVAPSWLCRRELNAQSQLEVDGGAGIEVEGLAMLGEFVKFVCGR
jgi:hypothetical protein